jgi:ribosomal protein L37AE/L43A
MTLKSQAKPHKCHFCGETKPSKFYKGVKSKCKKCTKIKANQNKTPVLVAKMSAAEMKDAVSNIGAEIKRTQKIKMGLHYGR